MAVPFTLPLQSQVTDENALTTLTDVKNEINNNNITTSNNTFTGSNTFQGPVTFENQDYAAGQTSYANIDVKVPYIELWNLNAVWNVTPSTRTEAAYSCKDKNGMTMGSLSLARETNGDTTISFHIHAPNGTWSQPGQVLSQIAKADGTLESRASEPPSDANDSRIATCKFVIDKINAIPEVDLTGYLQNAATGENSLVIAGEATDKAYATAIGFGSTANERETIAVGYKATVNNRRTIAVGSQAGVYSSRSASAIGYGAQVQNADSAIQIGQGRNTTPHTLAVGLGAWDASTRPTTEEEGEYILLQADGKIPLGRFPEEITSKQDKLNSTDDIKVYQNADNFNIVGTDVTIDEDKVATNFSSSASYLTANSVLFTQETSTDHTSFEVVVSFSAPIITGNLIVLREMLESGSSPAYNIRVVNGVLTSMVRGGTITGTTTLSADVKYYAKLKFIKGSGYYLYLSTDGKKWMLEGSTTSDSSTLPPVSYLGTFDIGYAMPTNSKIFLKETYISVDSEEVWKAATVSSAVLSAPPLIEVSAPTTNTMGSIGQILVDTAAGTGYMCVAVDTTTPSYTWKQITYSPVGTEYTLEAGNWNAENNSIEISIPGLTIGTPMWIAPTVSEDNSNELNYTTHGIRLKAQQADSIILSCTIIPTENISITIIR